MIKQDEKRVGSKLKQRTKSLKIAWKRWENFLFSFQQKLDTRSTKEEHARLAKIALLLPCHEPRNPFVRQKLPSWDKAENFFFLHIFRRNILVASPDSYELLARHVPIFQSVIEYWSNRSRLLHGSSNAIKPSALEANFFPQGPRRDSNVERFCIISRFSEATNPIKISTKRRKLWDSTLGAFIGEKFSFFFGFQGWRGFRCESDNNTFSIKCKFLLRVPISCELKAAPRQYSRSFVIDVCRDQ